MFLKSMIETAYVQMIFFKMIQTQLICFIAGIRSDHRTELENVKLDVFWEENGI